MIRVFFVGGPIDGHHLQYPEGSVGENLDINLDENLLVSSHMLRQVARNLITVEALAPTVYRWENTFTENGEVRMTYFVSPRTSEKYLERV